MDARAALTTIATGKLAFTDPGSIFLDGKNVLSLVVEIDCAAPGRRDAGRRRRRDADPRRVQRADRARRPARGEEHDAGARSSSTRSTATWRSATSTTWRTRSTSATRYAGAYRARLNANLAFWDGLDGKIDWPLGRGRRPPADRAGARRLPGRRRHQALRRAGLVPRDRARRPTRASRTRPAAAGRSNDDVMDTIFTQLVNAGNGPVDPRRRRRRDAAGHAHLPVPGRAEPEPARAARAPLSMEGA